MEKEKFQGTGRRKRAVARIMLSPGEGKVLINGRTPEDYFPIPTLRVCILQPLKATDTLKKFNVHVNVRGGGTAGQAEAVRHGIARALIKADETLRATLKSAGFLRRDPRMKERKKYGQKGARRQFQWTKR
ncbi:MAG: 30S ribosomal protein S9 [Candidatus Omnitrophota bacterium]|nr:MAG: 30S ribosomal protein S9 [Candidatus Omnitrophota bacterium]